MTNQEKVRAEINRRGHLFNSETKLDREHKSEHGHTHPNVNSRDLMVTNFVPGENGRLTAVTKIIPVKER